MNGGIQIATIADLTGARVIGNSPVDVRHVATDSRTLSRTDHVMFVAIREQTTTEMITWRKYMKEEYGYSLPIRNREIFFRMPAILLLMTPYLLYKFLPLTSGVISLERL